jgi:hypothetical protein
VTRHDVGQEPIMTPLAFRSFAIAAFLGWLAAIPSPVRAQFPGACCVDGACHEFSFNLCHSQQGHWYGENTFCEDVTSCGGPLAACCFPDDGCTDAMTVGECETRCGVWTGGQCSNFGPGTCRSYHSQRPPLVGDCDRNGAVTVSELVTAVKLGLCCAGFLCDWTFSPMCFLTDITDCLPADDDGSGTIEIFELVRAVNASLGMCFP